MRYFRIRNSSCHADGDEFAVEDGADREEISETAWDQVAQYVDYDYVEIDGPNGKPTKEPNQ